MFGMGVIICLALAGCSQNNAKALHKAVISGDSVKVLSLLENGVDVNSVYDGGTALYLAAYEGHLDIVNILLDSGAHIDSRDNSYGNTALGAAVYKNDRIIVKRLIKAGADVNTRDQDGYTVLMIAVANADYEIVLDLLKVGADLNAIDQENRTALKWASELHKDSIADLLYSWKNNGIEPEIPEGDDLGIVIDKRNKLIWQRGALRDIDYLSAAAYCTSLKLEGRADWRLPTVDELKVGFEVLQQDEGFSQGQTLFFWSSTERDRGFVMAAFRNTTTIYGAIEREKTWKPNGATICARCVCDVK